VGGDPYSDQLWPSFPIESDIPASESYALGINTLGEADGGQTFSLELNTISGGFNSFYLYDSYFYHRVGQCWQELHVF